MNTDILSKIADLLQISIDKAIELYPQLRTEAVWYNVTINLLYVLGAALTISLVAVFISYLESYGSGAERNKKICKRFIQFSVALGILILLIAIVSPFLFPDIVFFNQFIK